MAAKQVNGRSTIGEAAKILDVTQETVRRYIREGKLNAEKVRVKGLREVWMITSDELRKFQNR